MKDLVILTGAGISAPAGIPTFETLYHTLINEEDEEVKTKSMNELAYSFSKGLAQREYEPTPLHKELFNLRAQYRIHLYTTNIDDLHEKSGFPSEEVKHMHGDAKGPILFGYEARNTDEFEQSLLNSEYLIIIGHQLAYEYLFYPIADFLMKGKDALYLDIRDDVPYNLPLIHVQDESQFIPIIHTYLGLSQ